MRKRFLSLCFCLFLSFYFYCKAGKENFDATIEITQDLPTYDSLEEKNIAAVQITFGLPISIMQLVKESVTEEMCPSGWTELYKKYKNEGAGKEAIISLQPLYVKRFADLEDFGAAIDYAYPLVDAAFPIIRLAVLWPCFENLSWQERILQTVLHLQELGADIELTLSHHDSYPAFLETNDILTSGWANEKAAEKFAEYAEKTAAVFKEKIPENAVIYLINEPMGYLFNAYLGNSNWPPGGEKAGRAAGRALVNMREGLYLAAKKISKAGFKPAIAQNIRPLTNPENQPAQSLDYIFNWWLLDALFAGCIDNDFNGKCEEIREPAKIDILGITFYGTMGAKEETIDFGLPKELGVLMALPEYDFTPNSTQFLKALETTASRYPNIKIGVAEIGFSAVDLKKMIDWFSVYTNIAENLHKTGKIKNKPFIQLHSLFECAEFSQGDWTFYLVDACDEMGCNLTDWGKAVIKEILSQ
jgi:hypothetical protein